MEAKRQQSSGMKEIPVFYSDSQTKVYITSKESERNVDDIKEIVIKQLKYSSRIHLYNQPIMPFHKLDFLNPKLSFEEVHSFYPSLSFTYNNTQCIEEREFNDELTTKPNQIFIILQKCQENGFNHERFRIDSKANINFVNCLAKRYGSNVHLQYYDLRLPLDRFGKEELAIQTLCKFAYGNNKLLITIDSQDRRHLFKAAYHQSLVDLQRYYLIYLPKGEGKIVINREANWKIVSQMLPIVLETQLLASSEPSGAFLPIKQYAPSSNTQFIYLQKKGQTKYVLEQPLKDAILVGQKNGMILILEKCNILHIYSENPPFQKINRLVLTGNESINIDDQIPIICGDYLAMYIMTRKQIQLKLYALPTGDLKTIKSIDWSGDQFGPIQCQSLDILAVPIKKTMYVRVFYVEKPDQYYDIKVLKSNWRIWISKHGCNNISDGSGLFAISQQYIDDIDVYNLKMRQHISRIDCKFEVEFIRFHQQTERVLVGCEGIKVIEYSMKHKKGEVVRQLEKRHNKEELYYTPNGGILIFSSNTYRWYNSQQQIRFSKSLLYSNGAVFSKDPSLLMHEIQSVFIIAEQVSEISQIMTITDHST